MDLALVIETLIPAAQYGGSTTDNTKECFENLEWQDSRTKPTWEQLQNAWIILEPKLIAETEAKAAEKAALLERLGITADEAKLLLS